MTEDQAQIEECSMIRTATVINREKVFSIEVEEIEDFWETEDLPWIAKLF